MTSNTVDVDADAVKDGGIGVLVQIRIPDVFQEVFWRKRKRMWKVENAMNYDKGTCGLSDVAGQRRSGILLFCNNKILIFF
jgi:hypothetical protein